MYRSILAKENLQEFEFECEGCGRISFRQLKCSVSGKLVGQGFEYVCSKCRGTLKRVKTLNGKED
jgi:predicted SprT family Zn-dependent metalloprotease